jgi:hypothetical protein
VNTIYYFTHTIQDAYKGISHNTLVIKRAAFFGSFLFCRALCGFLLVMFNRKCP